MKRLLWLALVAAATAPAAADVSRPGGGPHDYFPLKPGWRYIYKDEGGRTAEMIVEAAVRFGKEECVALKFSNFFQQGATTQFVKAGRDGVAIHGFGQSGLNLRLDPPLPVLRGVPRTRESWTYNGNYVMDFGGEAQKIAISAKVLIGIRRSLPAAGRSHPAVPIAVEMEAMGNNVKITYWLARGVGPVRIEAEGGGLGGTLTLIEIRR